ncbi:hypothetical protein [Metabacillus sp. RGM 3146]|uniref:hypothetical protein n=1 Tax=Metabacillus sp. RGM 3146 TaxID=3401092 RepID=UPI003B9A6A9E
MLFGGSKVNLAGMKINSVGKGCSMNIGKALIRNHASSVKRNQGFGEQNADLVFVYNPIQIVIDEDILDATARKNDFFNRSE